MTIAFWREKASSTTPYMPGANTTRHEQKMQPAIKRVLLRKDWAQHTRNSWCLVSCCPNGYLRRLA